MIPSTLLVRWLHLKIEPLRQRPGKGQRVGRRRKPVISEPVKPVIAKSRADLMNIEKGVDVARRHVRVNRNPIKIDPAFADGVCNIIH